LLIRLFTRHIVADSLFASWPRRRQPPGQRRRALSFRPATPDYAIFFTLDCLSPISLIIFIIFDITFFHAIFADITEITAEAEGYWLRQVIPAIDVLAS